MINFRILVDQKIYVKERKKIYPSINVLIILEQRSITQIGEHVCA